MENNKNIEIMTEQTTRDYSLFVFNIHREVLDNLHKTAYKLSILKNHKITVPDLVRLAIDKLIIDNRLLIEQYNKEEE